MERKKRWYDDQPEASRAIHFLSSLPSDLQTILGDTLITIADQQFSIHDVFNGLRSLGAEKTMGLHQSQQKRRCYDKNASLQKAVNCLYVLPEKEQKTLVKHALELVDCVRDYFELYQENKLPVSVESFQGLANSYIAGGKKAVNTLIAKLKKDLPKLVEKGQVISVDANGEFIITSATNPASGGLS